MLAGIVFFVGFLHLLIAVYSKGRRRDLAFSLVCLSVGVYDIFCGMLYAAQTVAEGAVWQRWQSVALALVGIFIVWFVSEVVAGRLRRWDMPFIIYWVLQSIVVLVDRSEWTWTTQPLVKHMCYWGLIHFDCMEVRGGLLTDLQSAVGLGAAVYIIYSLVKHCRTTGGRSALPVLVGILAFAVGVANDTFVSMGSYRFMYLIEYTYMVLVLGASYTLIRSHLGMEIALDRSVEEMKHLAAAVHNAAESIIVTDRQGRIVYVNPHFEKMTGYTRDEVIGRTTNILKSGRHDSAFYRQLWDTLKAGQTWRGRFINRRKDGGLFEESASISPVFNKDGQVVNYVAVKRDITKETALEGQIRQSQKMAAIGQLAGRVAHDVTNKLVTILGNLQFTMDRAKDDVQSMQYLNNAMTAANRISTLTAELLAFAHPSEPAPKEMVLDRVVQGTEELLKRTCGSEAKVIYRLGGCDCKVNVDPDMIEQAIIHIAINSMEAMGKSGVLSVETYAEELTEDEKERLRRGKAGRAPHEGRYGVIVVRDNGCGMSHETQERLFEPFFTTKRDKGNVGLGLATVFRIVDQHNGFILVESFPDEGATFKIFIPAVNGVQKMPGGHT